MSGLFSRKKGQKNPSNGGLDDANSSETDLNFDTSVLASPPEIDLHSKHEEDIQQKRPNHLASGAYADRVQTLLTLLNDLHDLRATQFQLSIPSVAVIGNQSSGKSSLIEAICGINVPRDSGTCTRCPMRCEIRKPRTVNHDMASQPAWSAKISIEVVNEITQTTRFVPFGPTVITDSQDVELWILRAQAAILNPNVEHDTFERLSKDAIVAWRNSNNGGCGDVLFISDKLLKIIIEHENATPLTFIDLPGIVHNVPEGVPTDTPNVVRRLVKRNIEPADTIILVTIPAADDLETQEAFQLAREADPTNIRTLGVFTKSDLLSETSTNLLKRRREDIDGFYADEGSLGYFAVKLPDDSERSMPSVDLADAEAMLFSSRAPWSRVIKRERLGLKHLVAHVGRLLANLVDTRLPFLRKEVVVALRKTKNQLERLPPEPDWSEMRRDVKLHILLTVFSEAVRTAVLASDSHSNEYMTFVQGNIKVYKEFAKEIQATRPPYTTSPSNHIDHVVDVVKSCTSWELPGHTPYLALKKLISAFTAKWERPAQNCFQSIAQNLSSYIQDTLIPKHLKDFPILAEHVADVMKSSLEDTNRVAGARVREIWDLEGFVPFYTLSQEEYSKLVKTWQEKLSAQPGYEYHENPNVLLMTEALAYYDISSKRFVDYTMLTIENKLNNAFSKSVHTTLLNSITSPEAPTPEDLMVEDIVIQKQRASLQEKRIALDGILRRLDDHDPNLATHPICIEATSPTSSTEEEGNVEPDIS